MEIFRASQFQASSMRARVSRNEAIVLEVLDVIRLNTAFRQMPTLGSCLGLRRTETNPILGKAKSGEDPAILTPEK